MQRLEVSRSSDNRHMTQAYQVGSSRVFCLSEPTRKGCLVTEFSEKGEVLNQVYSKDADPKEALAAYVGSGFELSVAEAGQYMGVKVSAKCATCKTDTIRRELDSKKATEIGDVPVVPIFFCGSCRRRYYSMSEAYLKRLVEGNLAMFEAGELEEKAKDGDAFINTLREYIVRIFASKKIMKLAIE